MKRLFTLLAMLLLLPITAVAQDLIVTRHFTGLWDQTEHENQGIVLQIVHQDSGERVGVAYWFTYGADQQSAWFVGIGPVVENRVEMELFEVTEVGFLQPDDPGTDPVMPIGSLTLEFSSCTQGQAEFETDAGALGSGVFAIHRWTDVRNTSCSGGISDDTPAGVHLTEQRIGLTPARAGIGGSGHADFEERADRTEFSVEAEDLTDGTYRIYVGGVDRGPLDVSLGRGETEFRSPGEAGKILLTFDPRGAVVEVHDEQGAVLTSGDGTFSGGGCTNSCGGTGSGTGPGPGMDLGNADIEAELSNSGVYTAASGDAKLEPRMDRTDFSVEIEDVPEGGYDLRIGGVVVGIIVAVLDQDGTVRGELEFRDPVEAGKILLDFDPRGQQIEVLEGATVILEILFPTQGTGGCTMNCGGGGAGGSGGGGSGMDFGTVDIEADLSNTGVYSAASGNARLEPRMDRTDFSVEIEDVPAGSYELRVGGSIVGTFNAALEQDGTVRGELEFRDPVEPGKIQLNFDPRGQQIDVLEGATVILEAQFPSS
jgi:hypothetical protein